MKNKGEYMKINFQKKAKGFASILIAVAFVSAMLPGCGVSSMTADSTSTQTTPESSGNGSTETLSTVTSSSNETLSSSGTAGAIVITQVYGDGQKAAAVAVQYPSAIDASSISADDINIENYSITNVYTSSDAAIVNTNTEGNYVILILSTDYNMSNYVESGDVCGPNGIDTAAAGSGPGGNSSSHPTDLSGMADMSGY